MAANRKWSVGNGLSAVFSGSILSSGGVAAGIPAATSAASQLQSLSEVPEQQSSEDQVRINFSGCKIFFSGLKIFFS